MELFEKSSLDKSLLETNSSENAIIDVPEELSKALLDFTVAFLAHKPKNVVDYAVDYFTNMQMDRMKVRRTSASCTMDANRLTIDYDRRSFIRTSILKPTFEQRPSYHSAPFGHSSLIRSSILKRISEQNLTCRSESQQMCSLAERLSTRRRSVDRKVSIHQESIHRNVGSSSASSVHVVTERKRSDSDRKDFERHSSDSSRKSSTESTRKLSDVSTASVSHYLYRPEALPRRKSVFAEQFDPDDSQYSEENVSTMVPKSPQLRFRLKKSLKNVLIFATLDLKQMNEILDVMIERRVHAGEVVTLQGTPANQLFVIDKGYFKVYRDNVHVYTYQDYGVFGELALISNNLRQATIVAVNDGLLWSLERQTCRRILLTKAYQKRNIYEQQLLKVPALRVLTEYERLKLADAMEEKTYKQGDIIFKEGDDRISMYLVLEGVVHINAFDQNGVERTVKKIGEYENFFGELALHKTQTKRVVSAYAASHRVRLAFLTMESFERIVGDSLDVVKRSIGISYSHYEGLTY